MKERTGLSIAEAHVRMVSRMRVLLVGCNSVGMPHDNFLVEPSPMTRCRCTKPGKCAWSSSVMAELLEAFSYPAVKTNDGLENECQVRLDLFWVTQGDKCVHASMPVTVHRYLRAIDRAADS